MAVCHYHRDRPGIGVCMRCHAVICKDCTTKVDGINHCHACLKKLGSRDEAPRAAEVPWGVFAVGTLSICCLALFGLGWLMQGWLSP
jgi:hypothetical protein